MENPSRSDLTRSRMIEAAIGILAQRGIRGLTFVEICRRCELSRGAIHHHYRDLPALLVDVVCTIGERISSGVDLMADHEVGDNTAYETGIDFVWKQLHTPEFAALMQIRTAIPTSPELQGSVRDELALVHKKWHAQADALAQTTTSNADPVVTRIVLTALTGASVIDAAIGAPANDPERQRFRSTLKTLVLR